MASFLDWSVGLFVAAGAVQFLIGVLTPIVAPRSAGTTFLFTERADGQVIGESTDDVLGAFPGLRAIQQAVFAALAGLLLMAGLLQVTIAWFGLRAGHTWAIASLTAAAVAGSAMWLFVLARYWGAGASVRLGDVPPFMWVPTVLHIPAIVLGWIGVRAAG